MKRKTNLILLALVALAMFGAANATSTQAQIGGAYELTWSTLDGGGATSSTGGTYSLDGTMGQPDAGAMSGGTYSLGGGFWAFAANVPSTVYQSFLPLIMK